ncbi:MAG: SusD/RagB family nutrient-binding outer membrane lipoprotein [Longimonas sp.]|uniref:SusD/RagB family nutrient-binding outer membrane lipoprotein n=1 Tax=Longimonas sp. TaxID=2039626 RepID=UPI003975420C
MYAIKRTLALGLLCVAIFFTGCDLTDINDDPNASSEARPNYLFTNATKDIAETYWGAFTLGRFGNLYAQYWTQNQYTAEDRYRFPQERSGVLNGMWGDYYLAIQDLQEIIDLNENAPEEAAPFGDNDNQIAMSKIMQAWTYHVMTDMWGPIPFDEAIGGNENPVPEYNSQEEVYNGILTMIDDALGRINTDAAALQGDVVFGGDMTQWALFGNALKLRVATRMSDVDGGTADYTAEEVVDDAYSAMQALGGPSEYDGAYVAFDSSPPYQNPIYENYEIEGRDDWAVTENLLDYMNDYDDPRRSAYAESVDGEFVGYPYGLTEGSAQSLYSQGGFSRPGSDVTAADAPAYLMLQDEVYFALAEAAERGFISGDAATFYEEGIRSSMDFWGASDQEAIDDYIDEVPYDAANWRQSIGEQKWLALYMQGVQGWAEWRRLDFEGIVREPAGGAAVDAVDELDPAVSVRMTYPTDEANLNGANLEEGISLLTGDQGDSQATKLWWDVN